MTTIAIVGAGQAGLQLGFGLLKAGFAVTLYSDKSAAELAAAGPRPVTIQFSPSVDLEEALGVDFWRAEAAARVDAVYMTLYLPDGQEALQVASSLSPPAQSIDLRMKFGRWLEAFAERGGDVVVQRCDLDDLERMAERFDLVVVCTGRGHFGDLFPRDPSRCVFDAPQRQVAMFYTQGCDMRDSLPDVHDIQVSRYAILAGVGEVIMSPFLSKGGEEHFYVQYEAIPGQGMDLFDRKADPVEQYDQARAWLRDRYPAVHALIADSKLTPEAEWVCGRVLPVVREPVGTLPSGRTVMGLGDAVIVNDPVMAQGLNAASKWAAVLTDQIVARGEAEFTADWARACFEQYWQTAQYNNKLTNTVLVPLGEVQQNVLGFASQNDAFAAKFVGSIGNAADMHPWFWDAEAAGAIMKAYAAPQA